MRIDKRLAEQFGSRNKAATAIAEGKVLVNGKPVSAAYDIKDGDKIEIRRGDEEYVSVGGYKLSKALNDFGFDPKGKIFADIGASTGGFTDCLLQHGAKKVYCIDVGESQLSDKISKDKVVVIDNFNARRLTSDLFEEKLDGVVIDVSFISLTYILGAVASVIDSGKTVIALIKPQFETDGKAVGKNGIVKSAKIHKNVIKKIYDFAIMHDLSPQKLTEAPLRAGKNIEYLLLMEKSASAIENFEKLLIPIKL